MDDSILFKISRKAKQFLYYFFVLLIYLGYLEIYTARC